MSEIEQNRMVYNHYKQMKPELRETMKKHLEKLLSINSGTFEPPMYPVYHKLAGRIMPYPPSMPWMSKAWSMSLRILNEAIQDIEVAKPEQVYTQQELF